MGENSRLVIVADSKLRTYIQKTLKVSRAFICQSLMGERNSKTAKQIREMALENGAHYELREKVDAPRKEIKVLDSHGNVKQIIK